MSPKASIALPVLLLLAPRAHAQHLSPAALPIPAEAQERLSALVPTPPPGNASAGDRPVFYDSAHLYEYMDGAADVFQAYDVQVLFHREYKAGPVDLTVDIFDMGSLENAFGMYAAERSPRYDFVTLGAEGYRDEGILNFFQDRYYVKLAGFGDHADAALQQFATAISGRIGDGKTFPVLLSRLPDTGRKPRTEKYLRTDPLGHPFLAPAYLAEFELDGGDTTLVVAVGTSADDAASRMKALATHFRRTGQWSAAPSFGADAARGSNSYEGSLVAAVAGRYVAILLGAPADSETFFKDAVARLRREVEPE